MAKTVCESNRCTGCGACSTACPRGAINIIDSLTYLNAEIQNGCVECNLCQKICPQNNPPELKKTIYSFQGWSKVESVRFSSSSGGVAIELFRLALELGYSVYSCRFKQGNFCICKIQNENEFLYFSGSKYVKSKTFNVFSEIKEELLTKNVLFLGLPCQVAGLKKYISNNSLLDRLVTIDLICHGTPSHELLDMYIKETGNNMVEIDDIKFRTKSVLQNSLFSFVGKKGEVDCYSLAFQHELDFLESCYSCKYASKERVSDITLGDSWGTNLPGIEKGISVILCQTDVGLSMIKKSSIILKDLDYNSALANNSQLLSPSIPHKNRRMFFGRLSQGYSIKSSTFKCLKKSFFRQKIKKLMMSLGLFKPSFCYQISIKKSSKQ